MSGKHGAPTTAAAAGFGAALRAARQRARLSQAGLAERAGIDHSLVSRYESGSRTSPRRSTVLALADALNTTAQERNALLASAGFMAITDTDPLIRDLCKLLAHERLPDKMRQTLRVTVGCAMLLAEQTIREAA